MTDSDQDVWPKVLAHVRSHAPTIVRHWFKDLATIGLNGGVATIQADSATQRDYLERHCAEAFDDALRTQTEHLVTVRFVTAAEAHGYRHDADAAHATNHATHHAANHNAINAANTDPRASAKTNGTAAGAHTLDSGDERGPADRRTPSAAGTASDSAAGSAAEGRPERPPTEHVARDALKRDDYGTLSLTPDYAFEHFVVGPGNRLAHAASRAVADRPGRAYNPLFIHGDVGLGKTHLLQAICLEILEQQPGMQLFYTSCEHFMTRFIESVKAGEMDQFRHRFREVDALVIDDIHFLAKRDRTQEEFFHTFNALYQADKQIIMTSDAPPEEIPDLEDRLVSRFKWGLVTQVSAPTFETRLEIIKEKGRLRGMIIPDAVAQLVAEREQSNIRELEGDLTKLQLHAAMHEVSELTAEIAREALGQPVTSHDAPITVDQIITQITEYFGVRTADLQSKKRSRSIALPRQVGMYLARKHTRHSLEEIGGYFGGRDHTTVLHAIRAIDTKTQSDRDLSSSVSALETRLRVAGRDR
ncbi:MAG: chromosomal replication initiator protein DnaA [Planctomycetota bacterium]